MYAYLITNLSADALVPFVIYLFVSSYIPSTAHYSIKHKLTVFPPQEGLNIMHCAAINNHTEILEYIINDLQMKELDKDDQVST